MKKFLVKNILRLRKDEDGVTLVEYGIALTLALVLGTGALTTLAGKVGTSMTDAGDTMPTKTTTTTP